MNEMHRESMMDEIVRQDEFELPRYGIDVYLLLLDMLSTGDNITLNSPA